MSLSQMFAHEKLQVYRKALDFSAKAAAWTSTWHKKHALVDHLSRATESIVLNLAEAARQRGAPARLQIVDYAIGSSLECAGCLDLARIKEFLTCQQCHQEKGRLCEITKMLIGLRKGWGQSIMREEPLADPTKSLKKLSEPLFHHEGLEVYRAALSFMEWFARRPEAKELSTRLFRQLDEAGTSVVLNIAEGNGRYAELDHHRFLQIAQSAAVKGAVYLDLAVERALLVETEATVGKEILRRIIAMVAGF
jgi:four helix bundle protein